jgi:hypothetical protein
MPDSPWWLTKTDAARLCRLSVRQFSDTIQPRLKPDEVEGAGATLRFDAPAVAAALWAYRVELATPEEGDPLLTGGGKDSDELERYRRLKADMVERDLAERDGILVKRHTIMDALAPALTAMRGTGDRLSRQFGNEAADIFNEGVGEFEAAALKLVNESAE